jgi:menaquinone-dependent protoporphyrinogen oxidase
VVVYTTREGQTRRIAEHVAANLKQQGLSVNLLEGRYVPAGLSLGGYSAVILAASVHRGKHESEMVRFVRDRRTELQQLPTALLSVSLSQAGAQDISAPPDRRSQAAAKA